MKYYGIAGSAATQTFALFMDKFFDMLNVRSKREHVHTRKGDMKPYTSPTDERLQVCLMHGFKFKALVVSFGNYICSPLITQWLKDAFLGYLDSWEASVRERQRFSDAQKALMLLSRETLEGLRMTGKHLVYFIQNYLSVN